MTPTAPPAGATPPAPPAGGCQHILPAYEAWRCAECVRRFQAYQTVIRQEKP